jgi:hypothetical protein
MSTTISERLWAKIDRRGPDDCWLWTASKTPRGYGQLAIGDHIPARAHRLAFREGGVEIPPGMLVLHSCDTPACCNPRHLRIGTQADNIKDAVARGRNPRGERHGNARLTAAQVDAIRCARGRSQRALAADFGVSRITIRRVLARQTWR